jgi:hypothetical protein
MMNDEARSQILRAIIECELTDSRGDSYPAVKDTETVRALQNAVFNALKAKGLLKLDAEDC